MTSLSSRSSERTWRAPLGIAGRLFSSLGQAGVNVLVIAQGSSERNISFVIEEKDHVLALRTLHAALVAPRANKEAVS